MPFADNLELLAANLDLDCALHRAFADPKRKHQQILEFALFRHMNGDL